MTRAQSQQVRFRVVDLLLRSPQTTSELTVALHRADAIPPYWTRANVAAVVRSLYRAGSISRLDSPSCTRSVMWWAS